MFLLACNSSFAKAHKVPGHRFVHGGLVLICIFALFSGKAEMVAECMKVKFEAKLQLWQNQVTARAKVYPYIYNNGMTI